jgi:hypothetical protein
MLYNLVVVEVEELVEVTVAVEVAVFVVPLVEVTVAVEVAVFVVPGASPGIR